jgi:glycosyltransferase involved in cell wall biosynthesis
MREVHRLVVQEFIETVIGSHQITIFHPRGFAEPFSKIGVIHELEVGRSAWSRLDFEHRVVPRAAAKLGMHALLYPYLTAPLRSSVPILALNIPVSLPKRSGSIARIGLALAAAGARGASGVIGISDLEETNSIELPAYVGGGFKPTKELDNVHHMELPSEFVLSLSASDSALPLLLAAWSWVEGSMGDTFPMVVAGIGDTTTSDIHKRTNELGIADSVLTVQDLDLSTMALLFSKASVFLAADVLPWGQPLRWAMAAGLPIASVQNAEVERVVGDAAYLVQDNDARSLGAACLTLLVEEQMAVSLKEKGIKRATAYQSGEAVAAFDEALLSIASSEKD